MGTSSNDTSINAAYGGAFRTPALPSTAPYEHFVHEVSALYTTTGGNHNWFARMSLFWTETKHREAFRSSLYCFGGCCTRVSRDNKVEVKENR